MTTQEEARIAIENAIATLKEIVGGRMPLLNDETVKEQLAISLSLAQFASLFMLDEDPRTGKMIRRSEASPKAQAFSDAIDKLPPIGAKLVPFLFGSMMMRVDAEKIGILVNTQGTSGETAKFIRVYPGLNTDGTTGKQSFTLIFAAEGAVSEDIITPGAMPHKLPGVQKDDEVLEDIDPCKPPKCPKI